jgi:hypothetical protein
LELGPWVAIAEGTQRAFFAQLQGGAIVLPNGIGCPRRSEAGQQQGTTAQSSNSNDAPHPFVPSYASLGFCPELWRFFTEAEKTGEKGFGGHAGPDCRVLNLLFYLSLM